MAFHSCEIPMCNLGLLPKCNNAFLIYASHTELSSGLLRGCLENMNSKKSYYNLFRVINFNKSNTDFVYLRKLC